MGWPRTQCLNSSPPPLGGPQDWLCWPFPVLGGEGWNMPGALCASHFPSDWQALALFTFSSCPKQLDRTLANMTAV